MTLEYIAAALRSSEATIEMDGYYQNKNGDWGYHATVNCEQHWIMISVSPVDAPQSLQGMAASLLSPDAVVEKRGHYQNQRGVWGYCTTVRSARRWYMVSVSSVDVTDIPAMSPAYGAFKSIPAALRSFLRPY